MAIRFGRGLTIEGRSASKVIQESRDRVKKRIEDEVRNAPRGTPIPEIVKKIEPEIVELEEAIKEDEGWGGPGSLPSPADPLPVKKPADMPGLGTYDPGYSGPLPAIYNEDGDQMLPDGTIVPKEEQDQKFNDEVGPQNPDDPVSTGGAGIVGTDVGQVDPATVQRVYDGLEFDWAPGVPIEEVIANAEAYDPIQPAAPEQPTTFTPPPIAPKSPPPEEPPPAFKYTSNAPKLQPYAQGGRWFKVTGYPGLNTAYFVEYDLPGGNTITYFATREDLDKLNGIGPGKEPQLSGELDYNQFRTQSGRYFGGEISEVIGTLENYSTRIERTLLSPDGDLLLPEWANNSAEMKDLFYIGVSESWSDDKFLREMSKTQAFQTRYPAFQDMLALVGGNHDDALVNYKAYEEEVRLLNNRYGEETDVTEIVKLAIQKGYTVEDLKATYDIFERAEKNADALIAFQNIINAIEGLDFSVTDPQGIVSFFSGTAPTEIYDIYEASSISEQATKFKLDNLSVDEALEIARNTPGQLTDQQISGALKTAAQTIARYRDYIDLGFYGLTLDDVTNAALGYTKPGGLTEMEIATAFGRILATDENVKNLTSTISGSNFQKDRQIRSIG